MLDPVGDPSANDRVGSLLPRLTQIRHPVRAEARVSPKVFDLSGRQVATWVDEVREPAERTVPLGAGDLSAATYHCQLC